MLFGQYRKGDANDPETYVATIAVILSDYPMETIRYVTDPRTGIAANPVGDWTGMPNPADVKRACENHVAPQRRVAEREAATRKQIEEREQRDSELLAPRKRSYDELVEYFRAADIPIGPKAKLPRLDPEVARKQLGVSQEDWDAIPNAPGATA